MDDLSSPDDMAMPLVVTADEALLDEALRLCAAVGATPVVARDVTSARKSWKVAPAVLVCADLAAALARTEPSRRQGVVVIGHDTADLWPVALALGAERVCSVPGDQDIVIEILADALEGYGEACVVSVMGGCGGAGATTLAASLVLAGAGRGLASILLDADPLGGGIDLVLGHENVHGMRWRDLDRTQGRISGESLRQVLPAKAGVSTLSWDRGEEVEVHPSSVRAVIAAASRTYDLVAVDVPRRFEPVTEEILTRSVLTVLLVPEDIHALSAAGRVLERLRRHTGNVVLLTRARPGGMGSAIVGETLGLPVLGRLRHERRLGSALDDGDGPGRSRSFRKGSRAILDALG
ncbi:MAG: septum site-determining protein Ssd, partial [Aeromicrobium sp.]